MKLLSYVCLGVALIMLVMWIITRFSKIMVAGIWYTGYLDAATILLLLAANFALLEIINKK